MNNKDDSISKYIPDISTDSFYTRQAEPASGNRSPEKIFQHCFTNQEENQTHNSYEEELRELASIENGDIEMLKKCWNEINTKNTANSPQITCGIKNIYIRVITLASRADPGRRVTGIPFPWMTAMCGRLKTVKIQKFIAPVDPQGRASFHRATRIGKSREKSMIQEK